MKMRDGGNEERGTKLRAPSVKEHLVFQGRWGTLGMRDSKGSEQASRGQLVTLAPCRGCCHYLCGGLVVILT